MVKRYGPGPVPCHDVVGIVTAISSSDLSNSKPKIETGDKVMGLIDFDRDGAAAEEVIMLEHEICKLPRRSQIFSDGQKEQQWDEMLATIPLAGLTAWQALFQKGELREPDGEGSTADEEVTGDGGRQSLSEVKKLLITGASGAVGLLAVQLAIAARSPTQSIDIVAIASDRHLEAVRQLGADFVVPAAIEDVRGAIEQHGPFDLVLEMTGGSLRDALLSMHRSISGTEDNSSRLLTSTGKVVSITAPLTKSVQPHLSLSETDSADLEKKFDFFIVRPDAVQLGHIAKLMETGRLRGFVHDEVFSLERGREALEECEKRAREGIGKVVIRVAI